MAKIILWIVVVFVALFVLRLVNIRASKRRHDDRAGGGKAKPGATPMVRCARCGVFLPQADARRVTDGFVCTDAICNQHN